MKFFIALALILFAQQACRNKDAIIVEQWINQEIIFPDNFKKDTNINWKTKFRILYYIGPQGCITCKLNFPGWERMIKEADINKYDVSFIFVICTKDFANLEYEILINNFNYPIIFDKTDELNKINKFPINSKYNSFLLNEDNKVLLIGDPAKNNQIWKLYKKIINTSK